ncbi:MAG: DUF1579 domain-containing protein [Candidatus Krumholzibacteria bacterium]|nr:DUF1579 domain-containing protein [Candidatus Krumholzibacteria bacterium]
MPTFATTMISVFMCACLTTFSAAQQEDAATKAPCSAPEHRQFDFWLGEWDVTANGKHAGNNKITAILGGCAVMEEWHSANGGYAGKSFNRYDPQRKQWEQIWVDNQGGILRLAGEYRDAKMTLEGGSTLEGETVVDRITWYNNEDGTVRQVWQKSKDGGKSWGDVFDGLYVRKK